ncbi:hypothetical protein DFH06DRAFT_668921 [Mycena polygramma]|nr:hypothetical protein DFH06DRAFT_668921 [Mycena polygramma]
MSLFRALVIAVIASFLLAADASVVNATTPDVTAASIWSPAQWIWANSYSTKTKDAPIGAIVLRRTFQPVVILTLVDISISITADNAYYLYVNGKLVGSGLDWGSPSTWTVKSVDGTVPIVVAILAINYGTPGNTQTGERGPAGVLATFTVTNNNGVGYQFFTDGSWSGAWFVPSGTVASPDSPNWAATDYDNSGQPGWAGASVLGAYGSGPWGALSDPTASSLC